MAWRVGCGVQPGPRGGVTATPMGEAMARGKAAKLAAAVGGLSGSGLLQGLRAADWFDGARAGGLRGGGRPLLDLLRSALENRLQDKPATLLAPPADAAADTPGGVAADETATARGGLASDGSGGDIAQLSALAPPFTDGDDHYFGGAAVDFVDGLSGGDTLLSVGEVIWVNTDLKAHKAAPLPQTLIDTVTKREPR